MLIGIAIGEGAIKSVDDAAQTYVPGFKDTEYGKTPIRDLLHMSSGVEFGETKDGQRDLNRLWIDMVLGLGPTKGTISSIVQFNRRIAAPGTKYFYASIEVDVLGVVLHYAVKQSAFDYLQEELWEPTPHGWSTRKDSKWHMASSTPCCATMRDSAASSPTTADGKAGKIFRRNT